MSADAPAVAYKQDPKPAWRVKPMRKGLLPYLLLSTAFITVAKSDFQVNTRTSLDQANATIAMDVTGNFVVVWSSRFGTSGRSNDIFGQRFDQECNPLSNEFQINTTTEGNQTEPAVAMDGSGNFVVVWHGPGESDEDIFARRFDPNGQPLDDEFRVNDYTPGSQLCPSVAVDGAGNVVIVWESSSTEQNPNKQSIFARLFDSTGSSLCPEFTIDDSIYNCRYPDVAINPNGNFAVVWMRDRSTNSIMARLYNADGTAAADAFQVNTISFRSITRPSIAMSPSGYFVVTWDGDPALASQDDIHARLYEPNGTPAGNQFTANTTANGSQQWPQVAMNNHREFVIVWDSKIDPKVNERDIFSQRYSSSGEPIGDEVQVNTYTEDDQKYPAVALREDGVFVTVWQSDEQVGSDYDIFGRMLSWIISADFNDDGIVNFEDFCVLAQQWQQTGGTITTDLNDDLIIDERGLAAFCQQWLTYCD
jgi:hypothetical protein